MPRLSSQHSPMQHQPLRGVDAPRRRRRPTVVPGHPHFWQEANGDTYMGYDYRRGCVSEAVAGQCSDVMGIQQVHWINGGPQSGPR